MAYTDLSQKTFRVTFRGRERGAIGVFCTFTKTVTAPSREEAHLLLYEEYDHIHVFKSEEVTPPGEQPSGLGPCPKCGGPLRMCADNDPNCLHCDNTSCGWCGREGV